MRHGGMCSGIASLRSNQSICGFNDELADRFRVGPHDESKLNARAARIGGSTEGVLALYRWVKSAATMRCTRLVPTHRVGNMCIARWLRHRQKFLNRSGDSSV